MAIDSITLYTHALKPKPLTVQTSWVSCYLLSQQNNVFICFHIKEFAVAKSQDHEAYKLKLTGGGLSLERSIPEAIVRQIMQLIMGGTGESPPAPPITGAPNALLATGSGRDAATPKAFMAAKQPRNEVERITCLAYYLTHYRETATFKTRELTDLNIEAAQPKLSNASYVARNATQADYLSLAGRAQKQITARGEALVNALPDREKVRAALDSQPGRRRKKPRRRRASNG